MAGKDCRQARTSSLCVRTLQRELYRKAKSAHVFRFCVLYHKAHRADLLGHGWALVWVAEIQPFATQASVTALFKASYGSASTALAKSWGASWGRLWPTRGITRCS